MNVKGKDINVMFGDIAPKYDCSNRLFSFGQDIYWRKYLARCVAELNPRVVVDLATGSGDVAFELLKKLPGAEKITGYDFCEPMLELARHKQAPLKDVPNIEKLSFEFGDCLNLPIADNSVDAVTISFGFRNFEDRKRGLQEMLRILKPGGRGFIMEFTQPANWLRPFYLFYMKKFVPWMVSLYSKKSSPYLYLANSIEAFPNAVQIQSEMESVGFADVQIQKLSFGTVAIHMGVKC